MTASNRHHTTKYPSNKKGQLLPLRSHHVLMPNTRLAFSLYIAISVLAMVILF